MLRPEGAMGVPATEDHGAARAFAEAAGALLLELRKQLEAGADPDDVRREGDRRSHDLLIKLVQTRYPEDAVLSEEDTQACVTGPDRLWILDPLDGTREFGEPGRGDWAVHVALAERGELVAGAVALPAQGVTYCTDAVPSIPPRPDGPIRLAVSRTRPGAEAAELARLLGGELVPMGSAGAKAMAVVSGEVDVYLHSGGQHVWDSAAPVAVALAASAHASRIDGSRLAYTCATTTWLPDLLVCRPELRDMILDRLRTLAS